MLNHKLLGSVSSLPKDDNFENVSILLSGDGTNGAQNNTFLDSSSNNFTITRNGNTTQGSFSPYGDLWSNYFSSGNYLSTPNSSNLVLNASDFTVECWVFVTSASTFQRLMVWSNGTASDANYSWTMDIQSSGVPRTYIGNVGGINAASALTANTWNHLAIVRNGTSVTFYLNGVGGTSSNPSIQAISDGTLTIGADRGGSSPTTGYISNLRILKGTALYTSNFTPPIAPLTAITNTQLLTCQSNRFRDASANAFAITVTGTPSVQRFSPFNPTAPYDTATIGGSGYFDGSGDYLQSSSITLSGNFTIEGWTYIPTTAGRSLITLGDTQASTGLGLYFNSATEFGLLGNNQFLANYTGLQSSLGQWVHWEVIRSGSTITTYRNGVSLGSFTNSTSFSGIVRTGCDFFGSTLGAYFQGYGATVRISNIARTAAVPTAPLSSDANTTLLLNFVNAGIPDSAMINDLETVGNAQVSTSVKKYGTGSLAFDGTGDWLAAQGFKAPLADLAGDFTVEAWIYPATVTGFHGIIAFTDSGGWNGWQFAQSGSTIYFEFLNGSGGAGGAYSSSGALTINTWQHVAAVRSGSTITIYVNGSSVATGTYSSYTTGASSYVGVGTDRTKNSNWFNGYIDDLRITKGLARYTTTFTPPTAALPNY